MMTHIKKSLDLIEVACKTFRKPVVMFSGGKDSIAMLHLIFVESEKKLPVLFHKEPFALHKYAFGEKILRDMGLTSFDYPPLGTSLWLTGDWLSFTNHYQIGITGQGTPLSLDLPKNIIPMEKGMPLICVKDDILSKPTGFFNYPWDLAFIGHKSCDEDQNAGKVPLHQDIYQQSNAPSLAFPLRDWTHAQVWEYLKENDLPIQRDRYDMEKEEELKGKYYNSDYFHACARCVDKREGATVLCPKLGLEINNIAEKVSYQQTKLEYYG